MHQPTKTRYILPLILVLLGGCASNAEKQDYPAQAETEVGQLQPWAQPEGGQAVAYLNRLVASAELDALLREAMQANPGLRQTWLTLQIRRAEQRQTNAARLPTVDAGFSASKEEDSDASYTGELDVSWELDLWQKLSDDYSAAARDTAEQQALYQSARDTLAAEVMKAWLALIADEHAISIEARRLDTLERNAEFILQRYRAGLGTLEDLDSARTSAASSRASLENYRESLAQARRSLSQLLGRSAGSEFTAPDGYPEVSLALADLPAQTLQRRPDLQAAYLAIEAAELRSSVAYKDMLPSLDISAALKDVASSPGAALFTDPVWSLLGQLTAPLFQGGRLRAAAEVADLQTAQAYQAYRETLLTAVNEVEDGLGLERSLARRQTHVEDALASARNNLDQYQRSYRAGLVDMLDLLSVQQQTYDLEAQLDNLIYERLVNRVDIGLALGLGVDLEADQ